MAPSMPPPVTTNDQYNAMPPEDAKLMDARKLVSEVMHGANQAAKQRLDDGALVDGLPELVVRPLTTAARFGRVEMVKFLAERGADLEIRQLHDMWESVPAGKLMLLGAGSRALHAAACGGQGEVVRLLLRLGADPNAADDYGVTALMVACMHPLSKERVSVVRELLKGGASASAASDVGALAIHKAAENGYTDVFALLLSAAPTTISVSDNNGFSPLSYATLGGQGRAVAFLLSAGASDKAAWLETGNSPLITAVQEGQETITRMFLDRRGIEAAGGLSVIPRAMIAALRSREFKMFKMLLNVEGEEKQEHWANAAEQDITVLHAATISRSSPALHMLFAAGADLAAQTLEGDTPRDLIPCIIPGDKEEDEDTEDAIQAALERLFERAPACRARSWAWPAGALTAAGVKQDLVVWRGRATAAPLAVSMSIFRPTEGRRCFSRRFARYSGK